MNNSKWHLSDGYFVVRLGHEHLVNSFLSELIAAVAATIDILKSAIPTVVTPRVTVESGL
jgi:hypothetical protein